MNRIFILLLIVYFFIPGLVTAGSKITEKADTVLLNQELNHMEDSLRTVYMCIPNDSPKKATSSTFTYIFPIITLVLGIFLNKFLDYMSARSKSMKIGQRWTAELRFLEVPMRQQIQALEDYIKNQTESTFEIESPIIYTSLDCNIFKTLDKSEFLRYLERKNGNYEEAVKISNSTHGYINILTFTYESMQRKFDEYLSETSKATTSFSNNLNALRRAYAKLSTELEIQFGEDPINVHAPYKHLTELLGLHIINFEGQAVRPYNPFKLEGKFFTPFLQILSMHFRTDERAMPLIDSVSACLIDISRLRAEKMYLKENFIIITDRYNRSLLELEDVVTKLEKT